MEKKLPRLSRTLVERLPHAAAVVSITGQQVRACDAFTEPDPWDASIDDRQPPYAQYFADLVVNPMAAADAIGGAGARWTRGDQSRLEAHLRMMEDRVIARALLFEFPREWMQRSGLSYGVAFSLLDDGPLPALGVATHHLETTCEQLMTDYSSEAGATIVLHRVEVLPAFRRCGFGTTLVESAVRAIARTPMDCVVASAGRRPTDRPLLSSQQRMPTEEESANFLRHLRFARFTYPPRLPEMDARNGRAGDEIAPASAFFRPIRVGNRFADVGDEDAGELIFSIGAWILDAAQEQAEADGFSGRDEEEHNGDAPPQTKHNASGLRKPPAPRPRGDISLN
jgi:GNAT superfamily N-acetyltransferase